MRKEILCIALAVFVCAAAASAQVKSGLTEEDWAYTLGDGVTSKDVTYYSDETACFAKMFYPKGFSTEGKTPGIVLAQGWTGTHVSIAKYASRFADRGLVAMAIDYRGWGKSDGFVSMIDRVATEDSTRFTETTTKIRIKRTRLLAEKQVEDIRNAISYLQGEPGVDPNRIGTWGSSYAGGHQIGVASKDLRVKAAVAQVPSIAGNGRPEGPVPMRANVLNDAIKRAREGQGGEWRTGFSAPRMVDVETMQSSAEYRPFHGLKYVKIPVLFIVAENDELIRNQTSAYAAAKLLEGSKVIEIPGITHFEMYIGDAFEQGSNAAADWFRQHLGMD